MKTAEFDWKFDDGESVADAFDLASARRPNLEQRRVCVDLPMWMVESLDKAARRMGVTPQSVIKMWLADRLEREAAAAKT